MKYQSPSSATVWGEYLKANDLVDVVEHEPGQEFYGDWAGISHDVGPYHVRGDRPYRLIGRPRP